jgi:hypothetical protein
MALEDLVKRQKEEWHIGRALEIDSSSYSVSAPTKAQRSSPPFLKQAYVTVSGL